MSNGSNQVILSLDAQDAIEQMAKLKLQCEQLRLKQKELDLTTKQGREQYALLGAEIKALGRQHHEQERYLLSELKTTNSAATSLNGMAKRLSDLKVQYRELNEETRNSEVGKKMLEEMKKLDEALKAGEASYGTFTRNVGNYQSAFEGRFNGIDAILGKFGSSVSQLATGGVKAFADLGKSVARFSVQLLKSPIGIIALAVTALVNAFKKLKDAIALNDDAGTAIDKIKAAFEPFARFVNEKIQGFLELFAKCGEWLAARLPKIIGKAVKFIGGAVSGVVAAFSLVERTYTQVGKSIVSVYKQAKEALGFDVSGVEATIAAMDARIQATKERAANLDEWFDGFAQRIESMSNEAIAEVRRQDDAQEAHRKRVVGVAKVEREIAKLRNEEAQLEKKDYEGRIKLMQKIADLEVRAAKMRKADAQDKLKDLKWQQKHNADTSDNIKDQIAEAEAAVIAADTALQGALAGANKRVQTFSSMAAKEIEADTKKIISEYEKVIEKITKQTDGALAALLEIVRDRKVGEELAADAKALDDYFGKFSAADLGISAEEYETMWNNARDAITAYYAQQKALQQAAVIEAKITEQKTLLEVALIEQKNTALTRLYRLKKQGIDITEELAQVEAETASKTLEVQKEALTEQFQYLKDKLADTEDLSVAEVLAKQLDEVAAKIIDTDTKIAQHEAEQFAKSMEREKKLRDEKLKTAEEALSISEKFNSAINSLGDASVERYERQQTEKKDALKSQLDQGLLSQEEYDSKAADLDKQVAEKKVEEQRKQAIREKAIAAFEIGLDIAKNIAKNLGNPIMIAAVSALGAAQLAAVAATPLPKLAKGGLIQGKSHAQGGVILEAEGGEAIINKRSTAMYKDILSQINMAGGGVSFTKSGNGIFARGGVVNNGGYGIPTAQAKDTQPIYVAVTDINRGQQRFAKVVKNRTL